MSTILKRGTVRTTTKAGDAVELSGYVSASGRWIVYKTMKPRMSHYEVAHAATGLRAVDAKTLDEARKVVEAFEEIPTPILETKPFGKSLEGGDEMDELRALAEAIRQVRGFFKVTA